MKLLGMFLFKSFLTKHAGLNLEMHALFFLLYCPLIFVRFTPNLHQMHVFFQYGCAA